MRIEGWDKTLNGNEVKTRGRGEKPASREKTTVEEEGLSRGLGG